MIHANDAGGGSPGVGANVTLSSTTNTVTLSNGVITAVIQKSSGKVSSYLHNGTQMVDPANPIYYSMDGGANYEQPSNCVYSVTTQTTDMVDVSFKRTWNATSGYKHVFDIELHYVLRRGDTGIYAYAILDHPASYPATSVGEWRIVWKLPRTSTTFHFERAYIDDLRNWEMPSYYDYQNASSTSIAEIVKLNTGIMAGKYDGKYSYAARYYDIGTWGHTSKISKKGVWFTLGGHDYFNDGPTHQDLTSSESYILMHFGRNHFGGSGTNVAAGEAWRKMYGPFLLYCNATTATTNPGDVLWADAKAQVEAEKSAWPYSWLVNADHPAAANRGTVTGRLLITDPLKPAITGANAMVGLAAPQETHGNWQQQSKGYQYWARADAAGNFNIPAVRPGTYTLYAYTDGVVGEFSKTGVTVTAGGTNAQGNIAWNVVHPGTSIAWEIGVPDRTAKEFKHGNDYFTPFLWDVYPNEFPNPLVYNVGTSNPATDWNYVHSNYKGATAGTTTGWNWDVNFNLPAVPRSGNATLTVAFAGAQYARLFLYLNGETTSFTRLSPTIQGGNTLLRQGIHAKYSYVDVAIPVSRLRLGSNTFRFAYGGDPGFSSHVMYDYLRLELPDFPPPPPDSGRSIVWVGGTTSAANTWDGGTTNSFRFNSAPTAFGQGDAVNFDATGSNTTSITLAQTVQPNSVTFSGLKNFNLTGTGDLSGPMSLYKTGASTLTISQANTYAGITSITGGVVSLANDIANADGFGTSDVILSNSTLRMFSSSSTSQTSFWNIDVPGGSIGTLETDWRCELRGKLTGSGTFRYRLLSGAVRSSIFGNWSAFSGSIEASAISGSADFRISPDYNWPGIPAAALSLGSGVTAYWSGNLNDSAGTFVAIGELSGTATATLKGGTVGGRQITYQVGGRGGDATFAGTISEQTNGITNLAKQGVGIWTLSGTGSINGNVAVEAGTLLLSGSLSQIAGKSTTVRDAAFMVLNGTLNSETLQVAVGGDLSGLGILNGNLVNNGLVELDTGSFDINGAVTNSGYLRVKSPATLAVTGIFTNTGVLNLIGSSQSIPLGTVNTGVILTDRAPGSLTWTGNNGPTWDLQTSVNWINTSTQPDVFFPGDAVLFNDSATTTEVELVGTLAPASVAVSTAQTYSLSGGSLTGGASLAKSGAGTFTISSALDLTGPVTVSGGTLAISTTASWPAESSLIEIGPGATLGVIALPGGATITAGQVLRGAGSVDGDLTVNGTHEPGSGSSVSGSLGYGSSSRVSWSLASNSVSIGDFDTINAGAVTIAAGSSIDLVFNTPGSGVDFSQPFWSLARSWTLLTGTTRSGIFALGNATNDLLGNVPANYGAFSIVGSGTSVVLNWTPVEIIALWRGTTNGDWNLTSPNWLKTGSTAVFQNGLAAAIDDGTNVTSINLVDPVTPASLKFDATKTYTLGGIAALGGAMTLEKKGSGTLTLSSANTFTGGTTIHSGLLTITHAAALGTGIVNLAGGILETGGFAPANAIVVAADSTIRGGSGNGSQGIKAVSGSGVLTLEAASVFDLEGTLASFNGTVMMTGAGSFRLDGSNGSAAAAFNLGSRSLSARNGGTYHLGSLAGQLGSSLSIATFTGAVTYSIGGNGTSTSYAGTITNGPGTISIIKTGAGTLTLAGTCNHTGATTVSGGTLRVTGSLGNTALTVSSNAILDSSGSLAIASLVLQPSSSTLLAVGPGSPTIGVAGNASLGGNLQVNLASGIVFGRFPLITHGGTRTGTVSLTGVPVGVPNHLSYQANQVVLFIDDSDEDGLPDTWEQTHFKGLSQTSSGDFDGDGQSNGSEHLTGTLPSSGTSVFAATITAVGQSQLNLTWPSVSGKTYRVESQSGLFGSWTSVATISAAGDPAVTTSHTIDRASGELIRFYRVALDP
ncbi:MAG: polysaccharide lyase family protein [Akkermansiaceae bacterium]